MINAQVVLKTLCSVAKSSQEDLADTLGISVTQAKRILKGKYDLPKFIKQDEFAAIFGRYCADYFANDEKRMIDEYLTTFRAEISQQEYQEIADIYQNGSYEALVKELWRKSYPDPNKNKRPFGEETPQVTSGETGPAGSYGISTPAEFTLRHFLAMLTGGDLDGTNWAKAFRGQFCCDGLEIPASVHTEVVLSGFSDDGAFLQSVFPESILGLLAEVSDVAQIMNGTVSDDIKSQICRQFRSDSGMSFRSLVKKCGALMELADLNAFCADAAFVFAVLGEDAPAYRRAHVCYQRCADDNMPCQGLAVLAAFALLGPAHFWRLVPKESDYILFAQ